MVRVSPLETITPGLIGMIDTDAGITVLAVNVTVDDNIIVLFATADASLSLDQTPGVNGTNSVPVFMPRPRRLFDASFNKNCCQRLFAVTDGYAVPTLPSHRVAVSEVILILSQVYNVTSAVSLMTNL